MATQQSATVNITNNSGGNAWILLFHNNSSNGTQSGSWTAVLVMENVRIAREQRKLATRRKP